MAAQEDLDRVRELLSAATASLDQLHVAIETGVQSPAEIEAAARVVEATAAVAQASVFLVLSQRDVDEDRA